MVKDFLLVGLGGAIGSMFRYSCTLLCDIFFLPSILGTLFVNSIGSLIIGAIIGSCGKGDWHLFAAIGLCGGFTTFSTFSAQTISILQTGKYWGGLLYIFITLILCLLFIAAGLYLGKIIKINI